MTDQERALREALSSLSRITTRLVVAVEFHDDGGSESLLLMEAQSAIKAVEAALLSANLGSTTRSTRAEGEPQLGVLDAVAAAAAALKEHDEWREAAGWEAPFSAYNYQDRAIAFLDAMDRFGCDVRSLIKAALAPDARPEGPTVEALTQLFLESNSWETGVKLNQKFTGREARLMAEWLLPRLNRVAREESP